MDLTFIIVSWNTRDYLLRCLQTIKQDVGSSTAEIIVVDNASSDDSVSAVRSHFPDVVVVQSEKNLGFAKANNVGLHLARGKYICLVNSDVEVLQGCIPRMLEYMQEHPEIGVLGPRVLNEDLSIQQSCKKAPSIWTAFCRTCGLDSLFPDSDFFASEMLVVRSLDRIRPVDILSGCFWMVRAEAIQEVGKLDEAFFIYSEDKDWCMRFWKAGWRVIYFPEARAIHFGGASSSRDPQYFSVEMCRANLQYWKKYHGTVAQAGFRMLQLVQYLLRAAAGVGWYALRPAKRSAAHKVISRSLACSGFLLGLR
jgi:GT2 family glycosyltransferase